MALVVPQLSSKRMTAVVVSPRVHLITNVTGDVRKYGYVRDALKFKVVNPGKALDASTRQRSAKSALTTLVPVVLPTEIQIVGVVTQPVVSLVEQIHQMEQVPVVHGLQLTQPHSMTMVTTVTLHLHGTSFVVMSFQVLVDS